MTIDWQFVVVTAIALGAALLIVRRFLPGRRRPTADRRGPAAPVACDHCETGTRSTTGTAAPKGSTARTQTTPVVSVDDLRASVKRR
jgi:hypothetical protein